MDKKPEKNLATLIASDMFEVCRLCNISLILLTTFLLYRVYLHIKRTALRWSYLLGQFSLVGSGVGRYVESIEELVVILDLWNYILL